MCIRDSPSGVGYIRTPPRFLEAGQLLETEVDGIGRLRNLCGAGAEYVTRTYDRQELVVDAGDAA